MEPTNQLSNDESKKNSNLDTGLKTLEGTRKLDYTKNKDDMPIELKGSVKDNIESHKDDSTETKSRILESSNQDMEKKDV